MPESFGNTLVDTASTGAIAAGIFGVTPLVAVGWSI
jgi:hypothetical protein